MPDTSAITETLLGGKGRTVPVSVQTRASLAPARAFDVIVPIDLSVLFKSRGPILGGARRHQPDGRVGPRRRLAQPDPADGLTTTENRADYNFAYELIGFTDVLRLLVGGVRGEWTFIPDGDGTLIRWTYEFKPLRYRHFLVRRTLVPLWRRYMRQGLEVAARVAETVKHPSTR